MHHEECALTWSRNSIQCIYIPQKLSQAVQLGGQASDAEYAGMHLSALSEPYPIPRRWYMPRLLKNCTSPMLDAYF
jgi:hypothetical protein